MSKRFTDINKWKNQWFTDLPIKAKLTWIYLCDECESHGVWKANYKLASYQLDFSINQQNLKDWFGDKVHFFDEDKVLILQFFEFQYATTKDSWTAKVRAKEKLEALGFRVIENKVVRPKTDHSTPTVLDSTPTGLIEGEGIGKELINYINTAKENENFEAFWNVYPRQSEKSDALRAYEKNVNSDEQDDLIKATANFSAVMASEKREKKHIKLPATFLNKRRWRDYIDINLSLIKTKNYENERDTDHDDELKKMWGA